MIIKWVSMKSLLTVTLIRKKNSMPYQYAIEELVPKKNMPPERMNRWNADKVYHPVSKEIAETDPNGVFSLVTHQGETVTNWILLNGRQAEAVNTALEKAKSSAPPHKDIMGETLAVGDYVAMSETERPSLYIGKVVSFSEKKVRVIDYGYYGVVLKNASGLIKIHPNVLSD